MSRLFHHALTSQYKISDARGEGSLTYISAANCVTPEVIIYGKCVQDGTPTPDAPVDIVCNNNSYNLGGTIITAPELYGVGSIRDEYYPMTGKIVRRCGRKEVKASWQYPPDGSTTLETQGKSFCFDLPVSAVGYNTSVCSHFEYVDASWLGDYKDRYGIYSDHPTVTARYFRAPNESITTVAQFQAWLDEQKAKGIPVILVYALAEPVIEYVAPISLTSKRGANTITESGEMTGTEIGVKYLAHS